MNSKNRSTLLAEAADLQRQLAALDRTYKDNDENLRKHTREAEMAAKVEAGRVVNTHNQDFQKLMALAKVERDTLRARAEVEYTRAVRAAQSDRDTALAAAEAAFVETRKSLCEAFSAACTPIETDLVGLLAKIKDDAKQEKARIDNEYTSGVASRRARIAEIESLTRVEPTADAAQAD